MADGKQEGLDFRDIYIDLSWKIIEAKVLYYQPSTNWEQAFIDERMPTDAQYDLMEQEYLKACREIGENNDLVHKAYPGFEDVPGDGMMEVDWEDPDVKEVYEALCEEYRNWKRKELKKQGTLKKKTKKGPRPSRKDWDVWEGYEYPEEEGIWRRQYQFLAIDYSHALTVLQVITNCNMVQVFMPVITSDESAIIKKMLKKEPFLMIGEEYNVSHEDLHKNE